MYKDNVEGLKKKRESPKHRKMTKKAKGNQGLILLKKTKLKLP